MAHVSHRLRGSFEGALAGGGDPASSPLYVFGPFLRLIVVAGVANITFGASIWLVVFTVAMVSAMYRLVMRWVVDGSGGSGLSEEEFGSWAVKLNAGITFVEYTLTFLVSMAALVTFVADRYPLLNSTFLGLQYRAVLAILLSVLTGWLVNRGPKVAARVFGPATLGVLALLWAMIIATIWQRGFQLPQIDLRAFTPEYVGFTFGGYARILALMTGIEVFANLVAAYSGSDAQRSNKAFGSLLIIMGTTCATMVIVGPAILAMADPTNEHVSVFTQTMDQLLPSPLPYIGTLMGVFVLGSAAAAASQGLQNLALGLRYRHYVPGAMGTRNRFDVADRPVWVMVGIVVVCYLVFGTEEETYLAIYAAGVFILLSMTGWAAAKRLGRQLRREFSLGAGLTLAGTIIAAVLTTIATLLIFRERFFEGAWTYLLFLPGLYLIFSYYRKRLGRPMLLDDHLGRLLSGQYLLPYQREEEPEDETRFDRILVPLDGSGFAERALSVAQVIARAHRSELHLLTVIDDRNAAEDTGSGPIEQPEIATYLAALADDIEEGGILTDFAVRTGNVEAEIDNFAHDAAAELIVMCNRGRSSVERVILGSTAHRVVRLTDTPVLMLRPTEDWHSRTSRFTRLLVSLDGSVASEVVLRYARLVARRFESEIVLLSVPEQESERPKLERYLERVREALTNLGFAVETRVEGSAPATTIVDVCEEERADLIMMATRGRRARSDQLEIGSVTDRVVQTTTVPVFVVPVSRVTAGGAEFELTDDEPRRAGESASE